MKRIKNLMLLSAVPLLLGSCVISYSHQVTGNPIGKKVSTVSGNFFSKNGPSVDLAAQKGGISRIGSIDIKQYLGGKIEITVTGE